MRIGPGGQVQCENCGCDSFTEPQMRPNPADGDMDVFLCCKNCGLPFYTGLSTRDEGLLQALGEFFSQGAPE